MTYPNTDQVVRYADEFDRAACVDRSDRAGLYGCEDSTRRVGGNCRFAATLTTSSTSLVVILVSKQQLRIFSNDEELGLFLDYHLPEYFQSILNSFL